MKKQAIILMTILAALIQISTTQGLNAAAAELICPEHGEVLPHTTYSFEWSVDPGITDCDLLIYDNSNNTYADLNIPASDRWYTVYDLPADGRAIHVELTSNYDGGGSEVKTRTFNTPTSLPPTPPALSFPEDGARDATVSQSLRVVAKDPDADEQLEVAFFGREIGDELKDFTMSSFQIPSGCPAAGKKPWRP